MGTTACRLPPIVVSFACQEKANLEPMRQAEIGELRSIDPAQSGTFNSPFQHSVVVRSHIAVNVFITEIETKA
ncbi:hypothetical protein [Burkholderia aenigmatica]|uniref:hypothetical protein n=1 Tax=Burkholderia aenigmatica TaxID=2015348 RepID=UPI00264CA779|nr:hypothetical protein [Burkholderia aenigmatica]MDN7881197.1 hypothetical protein [Burkholderia aenigmatica]